MVIADWSRENQEWILGCHIHIAGNVKMRYNPFRFEAPWSSG